MLTKPARLCMSCEPFLEMTAAGAPIKAAPAASSQAAGPGGLTVRPSTYSFTLRSMPLYHCFDISVSAPFSCICCTE